MNIDIPVIAGTISTTLFAISTLPMLIKAYRTKDLKSYSLGYLLLGNAGNVFHSIYVFDMPPGPIWLLHSFYLVAAGLMLFWYVRYELWSSIKEWLHNKVTQFDRKSQPAVRPHISLSEGIYPPVIPHSGHDSDLPLPYAGSEAN